MKAPDTEAKKIPEVVLRIQQLFDHYGLNASSATRKLGYSTTSKLYSILKGAEPSYPTLVDFMTVWPEISPEWLLLGAGPMLRTGATDAPIPTIALQQVVRKDKVVMVTVDDKGRENTVFVPIHAQAGYSVQHNEAVYLQHLSSYRLPGFDRGEFRAFEVSGDSMAPTINHRDVVVTTRVDEVRLLEPGEIYVVVTSESVMLKRIKDRVRADDEEVLLYSDNPHRKPYGVETRDITELWRVRGYVSSFIPSAPDVTVERLWEVIEQLGFDKGEVRRHLEENAPANAPR